MLITFVVVLTCPFQTGHHLETQGDEATEWKHWDRSARVSGDSINSCTCALAADDWHLLGLHSIQGGFGPEWPGDSRDVRQLGGCASQRRRPTLQQELPVIDDPGA